MSDKRFMKRLSAEAFEHLIANGASVLIAEGYIMLDELVDGVPNGDKIRITGAMFQTWIPVDMWERMEVSFRTAE